MATIYSGDTPEEENRKLRFAVADLKRQVAKMRRLLLLLLACAAVLGLAWLVEWRLRKLTQRS